MTTRTPALWSFLGIYFNQDWPEDYGSEEASVDAFVEEDPGAILALTDEIAWTLDHYSSESELEAYLVTQGNEYVPPAGDYRGWLNRIVERLRAATSVTN